MPRAWWSWIVEVWRAVVGDRAILILLAAALAICALVVALVWR